MDKLNLKIMNTSSTCKGLWTRVEGDHKSVLDYVIMNKEDEELVESIRIDEEHEITPYHTQEGRDI